MFKKIIAFISLSIMALFGYVRLKEKRSFKSFLYEMMIRIMKMKKPYLSIENAKNEINKVKYQTAGEFEGTNYKFKNSVQVETLQGSKIYIVNDKPNSKQKVVLYIHGGAWFKDPFKAHFEFVDKLATEIDAKVMMAIYPKTPHATYKETFDLLEEIYKNDILNNEDTSQIIIMGDSAGGQISLSFSQYIKTLGLAQPSNIVLISPILDATLSNPETYVYEKIDPMLATLGSKYIIELWAGDTPIDNWRISPMFGDLEGLGHITISIGTKEALYPDAVKFSNILNSKNIVHDFLPGLNLFHVHPILNIPERTQFLDQIKDIIERTE
ncbi:MULTISPECIES: alpha/beta hydrolase fold domain-containing protein [Staphylococcaceae]|uniref:alpha/beta hydrolase fold domain-containing protein n=1 Tax=Mammaliicoccus fleurettii TaxID=150056 RepID=UPI000DFD7403|nr:alpha/beta hydrolase [Mammaliicoccus fleurettii]SUM35455.1 esterase [Mammaliicoccus fleurettii]HCN60936.1 alpha/beta hydrolase [Staphylococcus sp.]